MSWAVENTEHDGLVRSLVLVLGFVVGACALTGASTSATPSFANARSVGRTVPSGFEPQFAVRLGSSPDVIVVGTTLCAKPPCVELLRMFWDTLGSRVRRTCAARSPAYSKRLDSYLS